MICLLCSGGDGARKNINDLGHELIWEIAWNEADRRTASYSCRASPWVNEHNQPMTRASRTVQEENE